MRKVDDDVANTDLGRGISFECKQGYNSKTITAASEGPKQVEVFSRAGSGNSAVCEDDLKHG